MVSLASISSLYTLWAGDLYRQGSMLSQFQAKSLLQQWGVHAVLSLALATP